jgi:hypothetical protein
MGILAPHTDRLTGLRETQAMRRFHAFRQSLRARRLNLRPPGT